MNGEGLQFGFWGPALVAGMFFLLFLVEAAIPLRRRTSTLFQRFLINICLSLLAFIVGAFVLRPVAQGLIAWTSRNTFGLLHAVAWPFPIEFALGFLLMDLSFYYWHRANHAVPLLWRFHNVHHVDPDLDVTTSFRFHFGEILYSIAFRAVQVCLIGVPATTYVIYELVFQCSTLFHHSNVHLPIRFERGLNQVLVTPRMHGIHHSSVRDETNSNYSVIFRWWDWLHRSLRLGIRQSEVNIGVAGYREPGDNRLWELILMPFRAQKEYWGPDDQTRLGAGAPEGSARRFVLQE